MPLQDLANADVVWIQGSSMAEAHPVGFRWVMKAKERGAKVIHVDPRYGRTSQMADFHVPIRAGTDIAFVGGLIHQVLERDAYFKDYVLNYTNATTIINDDYVDAEDNGGLFSGFNAETGAYDATTWMYKGGQIAAAAGVREHSTQSFESRTGAGMMTGQVERDPTLQHPNCVLNILKRHFQRYTPENVEKITGVPPEQLLWMADTLIENSGPDKTAALVYAVGWTQHTAGVQMIRAGAILQLLLGNMGRPGGGILAARGHGHRVLRWAHPARPGDRVVLQGVRRRVHERRDPGRRGVPGHRGPRRRVQRLRPGDGPVRPGVVGLRGRRGPVARGQA